MGMACNFDFNEYQQRTFSQRREVFICCVAVDVHWALSNVQRFYEQKQQLALFGFGGGLCYLYWRGIFGF